VRRRELSDDEWELIEPFLPVGRYGPFPQHLREQFEGVIWRFGTGSRWREMPGEFGAWQTVYDRFAPVARHRRVRRAGGGDDRRGCSARPGGHVFG
jgi:transposase